MGAGDAFLAVTSPLVAAGNNMELVGFIGNAVGAMKVGIVGHRQSIEKVPLLKYLTALLK
jgi:sugar/nucleoside kinase (ribokinase family)